MALTGKHDLRGFWKLSPAELIGWCEAADDEEDESAAEELFGTLDTGEEVID